MNNFQKITPYNKLQQTSFQSFLYFAKKNVQVSRAKIPTGQSASMPSKYFARLLQTIYFKLRRMVPCALCDLQFRIAMPEQDEIQLSVVGMALGLGEPTKYAHKSRRRLLSHSISKDQVKRTGEYFYVKI